MKILKKKNMLEFLGSFFYLFLGCLLEILVFHFLPINNFILEIFLIAIGFAVPFFLIYSILNEFNVVEINDFDMPSDKCRSLAHICRSFCFSKSFKTMACATVKSNGFRCKRLDFSIK